MADQTVIERDVAVVGGGMAGLVSGVSALDAGADVVVLEKGPRAGGSMYVSGGAIWTFGSFEEVRDLSPGGSDELQRLVMDSLEDGFDWLENQGVTVSELHIDVPGPGRQVEPAEMTETLTDRIGELGGELRLETPMTTLRTTPGGEVEGVVATTARGETLVVEADSVVLATGGFQGNEQLVEQYVTTNTDDLWLRSNPWSTGDGLAEALDAGAKTTKAMDAFYGHNMAAPPAEFSPVQFREASQYYGPKALALNADGERYVDESISENEETLVQATAKEAGGEAYYVLDHDLHQSDFHAGRSGAMVERAAEFGGDVATAESFSELRTVLDDLGVDGERGVETVRAYNAAVEADAEIEPPRERFRRTFDTPPFYVVAVQPGITFTMGGLDVNTRCQVFSRSRSCSMFDFYPDDPSEVLLTPIPGLYAAGEDVGGYHHRRYLGSLALCLTTGRVAGREAADSAL